MSKNSVSNNKTEQEIYILLKKAVEIINSR